MEAAHQPRKPGFTARISRAVSTLKPTITGSTKLKLKLKTKANRLFTTAHGRNSTSPPDPPTSRRSFTRTFLKKKKKKKRSRRTPTPQTKSTRSGTIQPLTIHQPLIITPLPDPHGMLGEEFALLTATMVLALLISIVFAAMARCLSLGLLLLRGLPCWVALVSGACGFLWWVERDD
ncbi:hypothetical protein GJ744_011059 [Endocarpon pusillum]|uniref:Uncharacterized protein n=1 Tax=Endocarpon pusillum TaxID=364733 RepID=A0A8H7AD52_9EURO|nr:hypothetical protein GJ744_011059 [Endocarpon pusillum]